MKRLRFSLTGDISTTIYNNKAIEVVSGFWNSNFTFAGFNFTKKNCIIA